LILKIFDRIFFFALEKLPQFENYSRRFNKSLSQNVNDKLAYHYYIQQSIRNVLRRLIHQQNRFDAIKRVLQNNHLLPPQKDVMRSYFKSKILKIYFHQSLGILKMLRDSAMERFLTTPFEEREKLEQMKSLNARLSSNESIISKLEKELNDAIAERDAEVRLRVICLIIFLLIIKTRIHKCRGVALNPLLHKEK
jgi:hypothetical protein